MKIPLASAALGCVFFLSPDPARADLVAHYAFDEAPGSDDTVTDSIGANDGTLIGSANVVKGIASPIAALGTACDFGLRGGVDLGTSATVRPSDQWTMTWWMRPDTLDAFDRIYESLSGTTNAGTGIRVDLGGSGTNVRVLLRDGNGSSTIATHTQTLSLGTWYFVAVRYDTSVGSEEALKLTVIASPTNPTPGQIAAATQFPPTLGTGPISVHGNGAYLAADDAAAASVNDFGGALDDFAIFQNGTESGVLTDAQLASVATIGALAFDPPAPPPTIQAFAAVPQNIAAGGSALLSWNVQDATSLSISPDIGPVFAASGSQSVSPSATTLYTLTASNDEGSVSASAQVIVDGQLLPPRISEFVADNRESLADGDGLFSDWIELENPNTQPLDISGYYLTDTVALPNKWRLPPGTVLGAGGFFVVFASGQPTDTYTDGGGNLHTNFGLGASGEYLALVAPDGVTVIQAFAPQYPEQFADVSYSEAGYHPTPTPGAANSGSTVDGFVGDTSFSLDRGFYDTPFSVEITCPTPLATIYYTTDGTAPSPTNGTAYTAPVSITTTTVLRAAAFRDGWEPSDVDTQTYLFTTAIEQQGNSPPGYPTQWAGRTADYEMDPEIVNHPDYAGQFDAALKALPTLSIAMDPDDLFGPQGIYQNPQNEGDAWERPTSVELISPDGSEPGFAVNCGIRIQGGSSRNPDTPKHSFSLRFRKEYGPGKLRYNLFRTNSAADEFDLLQLRPEYNHGWMHRHYYQADVAQYNRDQWTSDLYIAMGNPGTHGRWLHLYVNGLYWGLYDLQERPDQDFMAAYFGGTPADYDTVNSGSVTNGDLVSYNAMFAIANGNIASNAVYDSIADYLDVDAFIDYMLLNFYIGNRDWDGHNWRAGRKREPGAGYLFFPWDSEFAISSDNPGVISSPADITAALNTDVTGKNTSNKPTGLHQRLALNAEYRLRFADRARRHMFHGGPLSPEGASAAWLARSTQIDAAIIAESARWGDFRRDVDPAGWTPGDFDLYTKNDHYLPVQAWIVGTYLPQRTGVALQQLRSDSLYPSVDAPEFSQHGGSVTANFELTISASGTVYYTLDGSDPRQTGGSINPAAASYQPGVSAPVPLGGSALVRARTLSAGTWSALTEAYFNAGDLRITELMYRPAGNPAAEFLELTNAGSVTVSLSGMRFTDGIDFDFAGSAILSLAPGERLLLVRDLVAFQSTYGNAHDARIAGVFANGTSLSNDGETLTLADATGATVLTFTYNDAAPWPADADGGGYSLTFIGGDPDSPTSWRHSAQTGGSPAAGDSIPYVGGDLLSYYLLGSPAMDATTGEFRFSRRTGADDASHTVETSDDLVTWSPVAATLVSQTAAGDGSETLRYQAAPLDRRFFRVRVTAE